LTLVGALAISATVFLICVAASGVSLPAPRLSRNSWRDIGLALAGGGLGVVGAWVVLGLPALGLLGCAVPLCWRAHTRSTARARSDASIVATLESVVAASRSGIVLPEALTIATASASGDLLSRLVDAVRHIRLGASPADALGRVSDGATEQVWRLIRDLELCARSRFDTAQTAVFLEDALTARRFARELRSDVRARTAGARFQIWLLAALVPGLALYLSAMSPTLAEQLMSPLGRYFLIPAGLLFETAGVLVSNRIVARACD
jgi:Flp pilus assembly protein TadB